jgi:hypothetical protein
MYEKKIKFIDCKLSNNHRERGREREKGKEKN